MRTVSTEVLVKNIKAGRVQSVLPMIAEKARTTWVKLPLTEKVVRSVSDLIQEGINHTVTHVVYKFDKKQGIKFTTYLYSALDNYYTDVIRGVYRDKHLPPKGIMSLDTGFVGSTVNGETRTESLYKVIAERGTTRTENKYIRRIDAERMFLKTYEKASPLLRRYLIRWMLQPKAGKFKTGIDFSAARREFKIVAKPYLTNDLCRTIQTDHICRYNIVRAVLLHYSTQKQKSKSGYLNSEEFALLPIVPVDLASHLIPVIGRSTCELHNLAVIG